MDETGKSSRVFGGIFGLFIIMLQHGIGDDEEYDGRGPISIIIIQSRSYDEFWPVIGFCINISSDKSSGRLSGKSSGRLTGKSSGRLPGKSSGRLTGKSSGQTTYGG
ncbi:hypothetical protein F2Q68_00001994 [Brassica cretica]|uniref:Uncharacterized protein n=1 Tax=Brassica cretica TaxID=69181 RepID=A0A8S9JMM5_BRACR|nr:hypothetical protein F2Q68_00001994 [Brassica cretica]